MPLSTASNALHTALLNHLQYPVQQGILRFRAFFHSAPPNLCSFGSRSSDATYFWIKSICSTGTYNLSSANDIVCAVILMCTINL